VELCFRSVCIQRSKALVLITCFVRDEKRYAILQEEQSMWEKGYSFEENLAYLKLTIKSFFIFTVHSECVYIKGRKLYVMNLDEEEYSSVEV